MATKLQLITAMYDYNLSQITADSKEWQRFLLSASRNYKLAFEEQILVHAQRPDATAVLELEKWNKQFGRWVNKGATGIAVIDRDFPGKQILKYYFDIYDTHASRRFRPVPLWEMKPEYEADVIETLEATFGELAEKETLAQAIMSAANNAVTDNLADYLSDLNNCREGSFLAELDELNLEAIYTKTLENSMAFMLMARCGIDPTDYFSIDDFQGSHYFNTPDTATLLGAMTSAIAEMGLREIASTVINLQKAERGQIRTFANQADIRDNSSKRNTERSFEHGSIDVQRDQRIQDTQPDTAGGTGSRTWPIRPDAPSLPQEPAQGSVLLSPDERQTESASDGDRANSNAAAGTTDLADGKSGGSNRRVEGERPDGLDSADDKYPQPGGGNNTPRSHIQLNLFSSPGEQKDRIEEAEGTPPSASSLPRDIPQEVVDDELCRGSLFENGKYRIFEYFNESHTTNEQADFLKKEYGTGGHSSLGSKLYSFVGHDGKGLHLTNSHSGDKTTLTWLRVSKRISELISADRYLSPKEKEIYPQWLTSEVEKRLQRAEEAAAREILSREPTSADATEYNYEYRFGDTVYIGSHEYEFISFDDDKVKLYDTQFPLLNAVMPRDEFDRKVQENPLNNHLRVELNSQLGHITQKQPTETIENEFLSDESTKSPEVEPESEAYMPKPGDRYEIQGRLFVVDSVNEEWNDVKLQDITFQSNVGFPIFRSEKLDFIRMYDPIREEPAEPEPLLEDNRYIEAIDDKEHTSQSEEVEPAITPAWEQKKKPTQTNYFDAFPDVPMSKRHNFRITDDSLGTGGAKTKFRANMDAIHLLHDLELDGKLASPSQQETLSRYVGWGSLPQAFDSDNRSWTNEFLELKAALSTEEYESARASTLNAHYTSPSVIKAIYKAVENMGFNTGNILDPGCGIGNFQGLLPENMADSKVYGIEIDPITGRIAQQLYQKNSIAIQGYEKTSLPDSFFDLAVGNVPFGGYGVSDKRYDKHKFLIHDFFFAKTLDKVRPGGVIAFITSKGTLDKQNPAVRKYIAQRADLLGAIRLPNNAFLANAGTQVTTDIIFLQKRDRVIDVEPDWLYLGQTEDGIPINAYFVEHPDMILGEMSRDNMMYGNANETTCNPYPDRQLSDLLDEAIQNIHAEIREYERDEEEQEADNSLPADPSVRNFSYAVVDGKVYFREDSRMIMQDLSATAESRIKGMIGIRDCIRDLIEYQTEDYPENDITAEQAKLNRLYDNFTKKYGLISSRANVSVFGSDSSFPLLGALEVLDEDGNLLRKADMFSKRTIRPKVEITHVDTASEALAVSLGEKACVDLAYMSELTGKTEDELVTELEGVIFLNLTGTGEPQDYVTTDQYLAGNVRQKLELAREYEGLYPGKYTVNLKALEAVQPKDLSASEIAVRLGATWVPPEIAQRFIFELLDTPNYARWNIKVHYSEHTAAWSIEGKNLDRGNPKSYSAYGTNRANAYRIIEETLNLKDIRIFDYVEDESGKRTAVLNKKETMIAQAKQEQIKAAFGEWVWQDPERRNQLVRIYNDKFNSTRPREYDGSHIKFMGMNPAIELRKHQINGVARIIYGGNTLLAHDVGAGKSNIMIAAAMEMKRLGLCHKSMIVVPNHIIEQFAAEYLQLYPSANILVSTKKDFMPKNRRKFCARIATGDFDAVIIGHSQFEKLAMSIEFQRRMLEEQLNDILEGISEVKKNRGDNFTVKQLEKARKSLQLKLDKLNDQSRKDDLITFEELGIDRLFVDESHGYKNLYFYTKMRNVGGIAQTEAQKSSDLFMKCRYLDEQTNGRGVIFATGTTISNSLVEMYSVQRYLQYETLRQNGLLNFDSWASTFGETTTAIELAPEGSGYRAKTRFSRFYNCPELLAMFREVADIQTADTLNLPVPKANFHNVVVAPSDMQLEMVAGLAERAEKVRSKMVDNHVDNMLCITNDGRKLALDQRLINPMLPDHAENKTAIAAANIFRQWEDGMDKRLTQLVFCDISTPKSDGSFNVYQDLRNKLINKGIPAAEIVFIHEADTEVKKKELFTKVRQGKVRVLMGSTAKCGSGMNIQDRLIALHRLDCPWRPSDISQQNGRAIRQGNSNPEVDIYTYITEKTFDAYTYQLIENKQRFISQIMTSKSPVRSAEDVDEQVLSYAEIKALATGNPLIIEKCQLEMDVGRLKLIKSSYLSQRYDLEDKILKHFPAEIKRITERIEGYKADIATVKSTVSEGGYPMAVKGTLYPPEQKKEAGTAILEACKAMTSPFPIPLGDYRGLDLELSVDSFSKLYRIALKGALTHMVDLGDNVFGNIARLDNALDGMEPKLLISIEKLETIKAQLETAKIEVQKPFSQEAELNEKSERLNEINIALNLDERDHELIDGSPDQGDSMEQPQREEQDYER